MRWIWIDRFQEFRSGKFARAVKNLTLAEEHLHDLIPGYPVMPASLILEGLAQTGGILVGEAKGFSERVILAKAPRVDFHGLARPGDQLIYEASVLDLRDEGASVLARAYRDGQPLAEAEIVFAFVNRDKAAAAGSEEENFVFTHRLLGMLNLEEAKRATAAADAAAAPALTPAPE